MDLPDPAHDPPMFANFIFGIDWIKHIDAQVLCINFLAELKTFRAELITQVQPPHGSAVLSQIEPISSPTGREAVL